MKIWKWYKNLTKEQLEQSFDLTTEEKHPLYAFTTDKKQRDLFRKMRKMDAFIEMKSHIEKDEYVEFANNHRGQLLDFYKYAKVIGREGLSPVMEDVPLLTTWDEKEWTQASIEQFSDSGSSQCIQTYPFPPMIFREKYFHALYQLQYVAYWKLYSDFTISRIHERMLEDLGVELDYTAPEVTFDEFAIFVNVFGDTLEL